MHLLLLRRLRILHNGITKPVSLSLETTWLHKRVAKWRHCTGLSECMNEEQTLHVNFRILKHCNSLHQFLPHRFHHSKGIARNWHQHFQRSWFFKEKTENLSYNGNFNFCSLFCLGSSVSSRLEERRFILAQKTLN